MTSYVNTTMHAYLDGPVKDEKVEDIFDLRYLKKYACPKSQHKNEWYLDCVSCKSRNTCKAGKQAVFIVDNNTAPKKDISVKADGDPQEENKKKTVESYFMQDDPVKALLSPMEDIKVQAIYQRVALWRKKYPDLEEKYHMLDKVRFLCRKPYDRMRVPEAFTVLYPNDIPSSAPPAVKEEKPTEIAPNSRIFTVSPQPEKNEDDSISLEDFLAMTEDDIPETVPAEPEKMMERKEAPEMDNGNEDGKMEAMLSRLEDEKKQLQEKIAEIDRKIDAIHTVQQMLA